MLSSLVVVLNKLHLEGASVRRPFSLDPSGAWCRGGGASQAKLSGHPESHGGDGEEVDCTNYI